MQTPKPKHHLIFPLSLDVPLLIEMKKNSESKKSKEQLLQEAPINFTDQKNKYQTLFWEDLRKEQIPAWFFSADEYRTTLHWAVLCNFPQTIEKLLVNKENNINAQDNFGRTPLMWATVLNRTQVAKILLKCGADLSIPSKEGKTCIEISDNTFIERMLLIMGADQTTFRQNFQRKKAYEIESFFVYTPKTKFSKKQLDAIRLRQLSVVPATEWTNLNDLRIKAEQFLKKKERLLQNEQKKIETTKELLIENYEQYKLEQKKENEEEEEEEEEYETFEEEEFEEDENENDYEKNVELHFPDDVD